MNNEINEIAEPTTVYEDADDLFNDAESETPEEDIFTDETEESTPAEPEETQEEASEETPAPFLEIKYNKETKNLTQEEAREYAQKGMNYDRLNEKYSALNDTLERLARLNNMDVSSFLNSLNDTQVQYEESLEMESLREKYPNAEEELIREMASQTVRDRMASKIKTFEAEKNEQLNAQETQAKQDLDTLMKEFPDLNSIPDEVYDIIRDDKLNLVSAYYKYLHIQDTKKLSEAESKSKVESLNETNRKKSLGNLTNAGSHTVDDFMSGFLND